MSSINKIIFEPWALGDCLIAASFLDFLDESFGICCASKWRPLVEPTFHLDSSRIVYRDLPYTTRGTGRFDAGALADSVDDCIKDVFSIRGDFRDYIASRRIFPKASRHFVGWLEFVAFRSAIADRFLRCLKKPKSRYSSWAELLGVSYEKYLEGTRPKFGGVKKIALHVGAQWRSRQYPSFLELKSQLRGLGYEALLLKTPFDFLAPNTCEADYIVAKDQELIDFLRSQDLVVGNDSGIAHLTHCLRLPIVVVNRMNNPNIWNPPHAKVLASEGVPKGWKPDPLYCSDVSVGGWMEASDLSQNIHRWIKSFHHFDSVET